MECRLYSYKHILTRSRYVFFVLMFCLFTNKLSSQELYIRVSENDCITCYVGFFEKLFKSNENQKVKFVFPGYYNEKRFDNFNKLYFKNKVKLSQTLFSDSLYNLPKKQLDNESGLFVTYKGKVLYAEKARIISKKNIEINDFIENFKVEQFFDFSMNGVSNRLMKAFSYYGKQKVIVDDLFRVLYYWDKDENFTIVDLKDNNFNILLNKYLNKKTYASYLEYKDILVSSGKQYPESIIPIFKNDSLILSYYLPFIRLGVKEETGQKAFIISNIALTSIIDIQNNELNLSEIVNQSYLEETANENYVESIDYTIYKDKFYRINDVQKETNTEEFSLFTIRTIDDKNKRIKLGLATSTLESFEFQKTMNVDKDIVTDVAFLSFDNSILLEKKPFAVDLDLSMTYKLDWDGSINNLDSPSDLDYRQCQFWNSESGVYHVLVKNKGFFSLKTYSKTWSLINETPLGFNNDFVKDIGFTKDSVYLFTENELIRMPNTFENF